MVSDPETTEDLPEEEEDQEKDPEDTLPPESLPVGRKAKLQAIYDQAVLKTLVRLHSKKTNAHDLKQALELLKLSSYTPRQLLDEEDRSAHRKVPTSAASAPPPEAKGHDLPLFNGDEEDCPPHLRGGYRFLPKPTSADPLATPFVPQSVPPPRP